MLVETLIPTNILIYRFKMHFKTSTGGKIGSYSNEKYYQEEKTVKIFAYIIICSSKYINIKEVDC